MKTREKKTRGLLNLFLFDAIQEIISESLSEHKNPPQIGLSRRASEKKKTTQRGIFYLQVDHIFFLLSLSAFILYLFINIFFLYIFSSVGFCFSLAGNRNC